MARQAPGVVHVAHREYLGDINPSSNFLVTSFPLNPGMPQTFPWLSQMASSYEEYYFKNLTFHFRSMSSSSILAIGGANTSLGTVILSTEYNAVLPPFTTKNQMENHQFAASIKPSQNVSHRIQTHPQHTPLNKLFIRNSPPEANTDKRLYDIGNFQIATQGMQQVAEDTANYSIGELWVSYDVCFMKPKISDIGSQASDFYTPVTTDSVTNQLLPFGFSAVPRTGSSNITTQRNGNVIRFANYLDTGYFLFTYKMLNSITAQARGSAVFTNMKRCKLVQWQPTLSPTTVLQSPGPTELSNHSMYQWVIKITGPAVNEQDAAEFQFGTSTGWGGSSITSQLTVCELSAQQMDGFLLFPV